MQEGVDMEGETKRIIELGEKVRNEIGDLVIRYKYPNKSIDHVIIGYHSILVEHHQSIYLLIKNGLYGSAFTLVRPLFEALCRGHWVASCASEEQIQGILKGKDVFPKMGELADNIDKSFNMGDFWKTLKGNAWGAMNDYTHTGLRQISRRFSENEVAPNYNKEEIIEVINGSNAALMLMALLFFTKYEKKEEAELVVSKIVNYSQAVQRA